MTRWAVVLHSRAFGELRKNLVFNFDEVIEARYIFNALKRAGERVDFLEERVELVARESNG